MLCSTTKTKTDELLDPQSEIYVHEHFDSKKILPHALWRYGEDAAYLLHLVYQYGLLRHNSGVRRQDRDINLKYDYLTKVIDGRHFARIRDVLEETGWLGCDHEAEEGVKAFTYWLGPKAQRGTFRQVPLTKQRLIDKINTWEENRDSELTPAMQHVVSLLPQIVLDESVASMLITQGNMESRKTLDEQFVFIRSKKWCYAQCDGGRLYTNITGLRTDGRGALRVNGTGLINVDISNSQFLCLVILIENLFHGRRLDHVCSQSSSKSSGDPLLGVDPFTIVPHFPGTQAKLPTTQLYPLIPERLLEQEKQKKRGRESAVCHTTCKKYQKTTTQGAKSDIQHVLTLQDPEWHLFRQLVQEGRLKAYVSKKLRRTKDSTKEIMMKWLFGRADQEAKAARKLEKVFPGVFGFARHLKREKHGNKWLAFLLTRIESKLVLDMAVGRIAMERPDMFLTTIHDSIMVEPANVGYVKNVLTEVYRQQNLDVHLKEEKEYKRKS